MTGAPGGFLNVSGMVKGQGHKAWWIDCTILWVISRKKVPFCVDSPCQAHSLKRTDKSVVWIIAPRYLNWMSLFVA